ncbi:MULTISPECIES: hypothetical protein [Nocardiopsis]|uniref:Uncharacterized protein n=1 Tax=Nocardiopsis sinuspersici TaxID=501010 RepID=A0A1V3C2W0_9ACTN|nr:MULTISPECIES: hypothetical protein [Nocardiopsis]OOC55075.1 hypothetical protein NOSIN_15720 [Nocardiopsis sinuspersici]
MELEVVQAVLRHASIVLTMDTYASVLPEVAREAAERTAWLVLRDAGKTGRHTRGVVGGAWCWSHQCGDASEVK